jgi:hypothetical protein
MLAMAVQKFGMNGLCEVVFGVKLRLADGNTNGTE